MAKSTRRTSKRKKVPSTAPCLEFLKSAHVAVKTDLASATDLPTFLATSGGLSLNGRKRIVEQALLLIRENYVHLPLKQSMHAVDPVQKLLLLRHCLDRSTSATMDHELVFHREMVEIFNSVRDLHTNYLLPKPYADKVAFLPFVVEKYSESGTNRYIASHFMQGFSDAHFKKSVEITAWNGVPIERAIEISAEMHAGSNPAASHARGIDGLTIRALRTALPPDAMWVIIGYTDLNGIGRELRQDWIVATLKDARGDPADSLGEAAVSLGVDLEADLIQRAKKMLFAPKIVAEEKRPVKPPKRRSAAGEVIATTLPGYFSAKNVQAPSGEYGYIRIYTFYTKWPIQPEMFIDEFIRLAESLSQSGLILDVRGNGGGHIHASEGLLQVLTNAEIAPEPTQFINTPLNLRICKRHEKNLVGIELGPWVESISRSVETGAVYSQGVPITPPSFANKKGQKYHGPVVLITDARCYSATDIFAAGFKDHAIGKLLGVDDNTGAGGANVWTHEVLRLLLETPPPADPDTPYKKLHNNAGMRVSVRRTLRVGEYSGNPVEDLGISPDLRHHMTKEDLLSGNQDLIAKACQLLDDMPVRLLAITANKTGPTLTLQVETAGLTRLDTYIDGRPVDSRDVSNGIHNVVVNLPPGASVLECAGFDGPDYVAARRIDL